MPKPSRIIPCEQNANLRGQIEQFAEVLKTSAHTLGGHGLEEKDFYNSLFRGAIERIRGQFSATMRPKREFVQHILNHMEDAGYIAGWDTTEAAERNDYRVRLPSGKVAVIGLTGAMDGQNTTIFERPTDADEFVIWSVVTNPGSDPQRNAWSGIHTRLSAEMIARKDQIDGVIIWDMICGTTARPCPKIDQDSSRFRMTEVGPFRVPPACIYMFPAVAPSFETSSTKAQQVSDVELLLAFHTCFHGRNDEVNYTDFEVEDRSGEIFRKTTVVRGGVIQRESSMTPLRRGPK